MEAIDPQDRPESGTPAASEDPTRIPDSEPGQGGEPVETPAGDDGPASTPEPEVTPGEPVDTPPVEPEAEPSEPEGEPSGGTEPTE